MKKYEKDIKDEKEIEDVKVEDTDDKAAGQRDRRVLQAALSSRLTFHQELVQKTYQ